MQEQLGRMEETLNKIAEDVSEIKKDVKHLVEQIKITAKDFKGKVKELLTLFEDGNNGKRSQLLKFPDVDRPEILTDYEKIQ